jgi:hypothetical protein
MTGLSLKTRRAARRHRVRYSFLFMRANGAQLDEITKLIDTKVLRPIIDRAYPFDETPQVLAHVESSRTKGKVVSQRSDAHQTRYADIVSPSLSLHLQRAAIRAPRARFRPSASARVPVRGAPTADEPQSSGPTLTSRLLCPADARLRRPREPGIQFRQAAGGVRLALRARERVPRAARYGAVAGIRSRRLLSSWELVQPAAQEAEHLVEDRQRLVERDGFTGLGPNAFAYCRERGGG